MTLQVAALIANQGGDGRTDQRKDGRLEIPPYVLQDIGPLGSLPKKPARADDRLEMENLRLERADLRLGRADLKPERADLRPYRPDIRPGRPDEGNKWIDKQTN